MPHAYPENIRQLVEIRMQPRSVEVLGISGRDGSHDSYLIRMGVVEMVGISVASNIHQRLKLDP